MAKEDVTVQATEGHCPAQIFTPAVDAGAGEGPWPGVIFFPDGIGIRPVLAEMAQRIADWGYVVMLPDVFYRVGPYPPNDPKEFFANPEKRASMGSFFASTDNHRAAQDTAYFLDYLHARADVGGNKVGTTGYCMGGGISLTVAGTWPDRIGVAASFHGGGLVSDTPLSPHLRVPNITGFVYIGWADDDPHYPPQMHAALEAVLDEAGVGYEAEFYTGSLHGWTMSDFPVYDEPAAEKHFAVLKRLFAAHLG